MIKLMHTENIYHTFHFSDLLLLFYLLTIRGFLFMIHPFLILLYEVYNPLAQHFQN